MVDRPTKKILKKNLDGESRFEILTHGHLMLNPIIQRGFLPAWILDVNFNFEGSLPMRYPSHNLTVDRLLLRDPLNRLQRSLLRFQLLGRRPQIRKSVTG